MAVRRIIEEQYGTSLERKAQVEGELASLAGAEHGVKQNLDPKRVLERLHNLAELIERGEKPINAEVQTQRLFKIEGNFDTTAIEKIANTLLVDPVVEKPPAAE